MQTRLGSRYTRLLWVLKGPAQQFEHIKARGPTTGVRVMRESFKRTINVDIRDSVSGDPYVDLEREAEMLIRSQ